MKYLWLDFLLAFLIYQLGIYTYSHTTAEYLLNQEVEVFNEDVKNGEIMKNYHIPKETNPNEISNFIEELNSSAIASDFFKNLPAHIFSIAL